MKAVSGTEIFPVQHVKGGAVIHRGIDNILTLRRRTLRR